MGSGDEARFGEGGGAAPVEVVASALHALLVRAMPHPWSEAQVADALAHPRAEVRVASAEDGGEGPVACVVGRWPADDLLEIDLVAVDPGRRREGRARDLLERVLADAAARGASECQLELSSQNVAAFALYVGVGFVVVGRRARYYPDGADALLLSWRAPEG